MPKSNRSNLKTALLLVSILAVAACAGYFAPRIVINAQKQESAAGSTTSLKVPAAKTKSKAEQEAERNKWREELAKETSNAVRESHLAFFKYVNALPKDKKIKIVFRIPPIRFTYDSRYSDDDIEYIENETHVCVGFADTYSDEERPSWSIFNGTKAESDQFYSISMQLSSDEIKKYFAPEGKEFWLYAYNTGGVEFKTRNLMAPYSNNEGSVGYAIEDDVIYVSLTDDSLILNGNKNDIKPNWAEKNGVKIRKQYFSYLFRKDCLAATKQVEKRTNGEQYLFSDL